MVLTPFTAPMAVTSTCPPAANGGFGAALVAGSAIGVAVLSDPGAT